MHLLHKNRSWQTFSCPEAPITSRMCSWQFRHQHFWTGGDFCSPFSMYRTKFDAKMTKSKWNDTVNMIMNVSGTVCQRIHYFLSKQWLALKVNNAHGFDIISWSVWILILLEFGAIVKYIINKISYSLGTRKVGWVNWTFKQSKWGTVK